MTETVLAELAGLSSSAATTAHLTLLPTGIEGVDRLGVVFVNLYAVKAGAGFVLVDTGLPGTAGYVRRAVAARFGEDARPRAIILTHAHFDHAGNAQELADHYGVPVYAHEKELPYLIGQSDYAPGDPTPGGAICFLSRFFPHGGRDLGDRVKPLPADGTVPELDGWRWIHTPGHTVGHVSLFREGDRSLLAGDALATTDLDAWTSQATWPRKLSRPATPFTPDWPSAKASVASLAELRPLAIAAGHGLPIVDVELPAKLYQFSAQVHGPHDARYSDRPATYDDRGRLRDVPPPAPDPLPKQLIVAGGIVLAGFGIAALLRREQKPQTFWERTRDATVSRLRREQRRFFA